MLAPPLFGASLPPREQVTPPTDVVRVLGMSVLCASMTPVTSKTNTTPVVGDVYRCAPSTSANGDVHGENGRLCGTVEVLPRVITTLTRTTHPERGARTLESGKRPEIGLTKDGYWTDHNQRPLPRSWLGDAGKCEYTGRLPKSETDALVYFWATTKLLGRENQ